MIKPAHLYIEQIAYKTWEIAYNKKYMYANIGYTSSYKPSDDNWYCHEFVSVKNNEVIGYITYSTKRNPRIAYDFYAVNYTDSPIFAIDLLRAIDNIFIEFGFQKIDFSVIVGNPIEKSYDKLISMYGGRVVGVLKNDVCLLDGNIYDKKLYELSIEDYVENKKRIGIKL